MANSIPEEDAHYFRELLSRRDSALGSTYRAVVLTGNRMPELSQCHSNADSFVVSNPDYVVVQGWLIETYLSALVAHSLVRLRGGAELVEITGDHRYAFIVHVGECLVFERLSKRYPRFAEANLEVKLNNPICGAAEFAGF